MPTFPAARTFEWPRHVDDYAPCRCWHPGAGGSVLSSAQLAPLSRKVAMCGLRAQPMTAPCGPWSFCGVIVHAHVFEPHARAALVGEREEAAGFGVRQQSARVLSP